jgi:hypothetical protein
MRNEYSSNAPVITITAISIYKKIGNVASSRRCRIKVENQNNLRKFKRLLRWPPLNDSNSVLYNVVLYYVKVQPDLEELEANMEENEDTESSKEDLHLGKLHFSMDYDFTKSEVRI